MAPHPTEGPTCLVFSFRERWSAVRASGALFRDARAYCDGNAAITDWPVVFGADTDSVVDEVVVWVEQGSASSSSFRLLDRQGGWDWYGEVWEDDMGVMDCDAHGTYVFQAWAGTVSETIYLDF